MNRWKLAAFTAAAALLAVLSIVVTAGSANAAGSGFGQTHTRYLVVVDFCTHHPIKPGPRVQYRVFWKHDQSDNNRKRSAKYFNVWNVRGIEPTTYGQIASVTRVQISPNGERTKVLDHIEYFRFNAC